MIRIKKTQSIKFNMVSTKEFIPQMLLLLYVITDFIRFFGIASFNTVNAIYVVIGLMCIIFTIMKRGISKQIPLFKFIYVYTFFAAVGILTNSNIDLKEIFWPLAFMGLSIMILNFRIQTNFIKLIYFLSSSFLALAIITAGGVNNLQAATSRNTIGMMLLVYFCLYAITSYNNHEKLGIVPVVWGLLVTIIAIGRSSIITFALLLLAFLIFDFNPVKQRLRNPTKLIAGIIIIAIIFSLSYRLFEPFYMQTLKNYSQRGLESVRTLIWSDYIDKVITSPWYILFGAPIEGSYILNRYSHNLHNSFLMLHAKYGLIILLTVGILIIRAVTYYLRKRNYLYLTLLFAVLFRTQFDYLNFNAHLDILLFYLLFYKYYVPKCQYN